jgi:IS30 family transposase
MGRPTVPVDVRRRFWRVVRDEGCSAVEAAGVVGVSAMTGKRWFGQAGGVVPSIVAAPSGFRLSFAEREEIACLSAAGVCISQIARRLGRHKSTVSRELRRACVGSRGYRASVAQAEADRFAARPKPGRLASSPRLQREVADRLRQHHSPEQIARRLVLEFPDDPELRVSHETIYRSLYVQGKGELRRELARCLRTGRAVRKPRRTTARRRGRIKDMVMISQRPPEVEDRAVPGNWEGDLIIGKDSASAIGTLVERTTRYCLLLHLPGGHTAEDVQTAMISKMSELPQHLRRTLTWDQGTEMTNHAAIYFCDPHSPWQRGSNENTNGLLRQYFPKGTDLSFYGPGYLDTIAAELNNRPRKTLNWKTPAEALDKLLSTPPNPPTVALTT